MKHQGAVDDQAPSRWSRAPCVWSDELLVMDIRTWKPWCRCRCSGVVVLPGLVAEGYYRCKGGSHELHAKLLEYIVEEQQLRDVLRVVAAPADGRGTRAPARQHKFRASQPKCARDSADPRRRVRGAGRGHPFKPQSSSRRCFASRRPTCEVLLVGASLMIL